MENFRETVRSKCEHLTPGGKLLAFCGEAS